MVGIGCSVKCIAIKRIIGDHAWFKRRCRALLGIEICYLLSSHGCVKKHDFVQTAIKVQAATDRVKAHTQWILGGIKCAGDGFCIGHGTIQIDDIVGSIVSHNDLMPITQGEFIAIARVHVGYTIR